MSGPNIAVVIPAYNAAETIGETLDALQHNDGIDRLLLVVLLNDCSTDDTVVVARKNWHSNVPLEVWDNRENLGERRTTNAAIARLAERVEWTFILHADDVVKPNWLSLYFEELDKAPTSVVTICSSYDTWWPDTGKIEPGEEFPDRTAVHVRGERKSVIGTLDKGCWWHLSGCGIRNRVFLDIGGFEPDMPQLGDWEWLLRCLSNGHDVWYLPRSTMLYRQHSKSVSSRSFREARDLEEKQRIFRLMKEKGYLSDSEHRSRLRNLLKQLVRRAIVRLARGDVHGFQKCSSLLVGAGFEYVRARS